MEGRPVWLEPSEGEKERYEAQLEIWTEIRFQDFAGHAKDFGFYYKYFKKALEGFRKKREMITRY